jgi:hypothetical protein
MILKNDFVKEVLKIAEDSGYTIEIGKRNKLQQIDFGNKKLHAKHLEKLYPKILSKDANIATLGHNLRQSRRLEI